MSTTDGDVAIGLEDAPQVGADLVVRSGVEPLGNPDIRTPLEQAPALDEVPHYLAIDADALDLGDFCIGIANLEVNER